MTRPGIADVGAYLTAHGTGLSVDERRDLYRSPDEPGYSDLAILPDGRHLTSGDIFEVRSVWHGVCRYSFRRVRIVDNEVTGWGPISGHDQHWHTFRIEQVV